jgi:Protein of unknown function (DUF3300)
MKTFLKSLMIGLLAVTLTGPAAVAEERPAFSDEELDQMLAPIALYPDSLLSQVLMASTYPLEVVQAARWSRANPSLKGDDAVKAVESMDWDPSVKSLVAFPQILQRMDERLDWTQRLGEAFLAQEPHVLDAIQGLRQRAAVAGNLSSNEQLRVTRQDEAILIEPARPEAVYVPYYNPAVVYGPWAWTGYPPVYWGPFPGYYAAPAFSPVFFWGPAIVVSTGFFFGHANWHHHHVAVHHDKHFHSRYGKHQQTVGAAQSSKAVAWKHDPVHRRGVPYRHASLHDQFGKSGQGARGGNGWRDQRAPGPAPSARQGSGGQTAGGRDGRDDRRDFTDRGGREGGSQQRPSTQGSNNAPDGRGKPGFNPGSRSSGTSGPAPQGGDRRSDAGRDQSRFQGRGPAPQHEPGRPAARQPQHADANRNNNVLRFPAPQATPSAPAAQQGRGPDTAGNVHRFQGHVPAPRSAPAPAPRAQPRPAAAPQRSAHPGGAAPRQPMGSAPVAGPGNRGQASHPVAMPQRSAPAPQAQARGNSAPRMANGNGNFRGGGGGGGNGGRGGGSFR